MTVPYARNPLAILVLLLATATLAACETVNSGPAAQAAPEPPMTHSRAATECWMATEKGRAGMDLDKRADVVTKCIDDKMKAAKTM
jgi:hypothetical protein